MEKIGSQENRKSTYYNSAENEKTQENQKSVRDKRENQKSVKDKQRNRGGSIFAGDLKLGQSELIAKKDKMKMDALKILTDAFSNDQKIDEGLNKHHSKIAELEKEASQTLGEIKRIEELKKDMKDTYGITDDSMEQKDLELMEKKKSIDRGLSDAVLTQEEKERLKSMGPATDYQKVALEYHDIELMWQEKLTNIKDTIKMENQIIEAVEQARLQVHPIVDAQKDTKKMIDAAGKELIGGLMQEVKEKIDEKIDENADKAEEIKEKEKKQEEAVKADKKEDKKKAKKKDEIIVPDEVDQPREVDWSKIFRQIKSIVEMENLLDEDIKGMTVDKQL